jgi:hypothetical protein
MGWRSLILRPDWQTYEAGRRRDHRRESGADCGPSGMGGPPPPCSSSPRSGGAFSTTTKSHPSASDFRTEAAITRTRMDVGTRGSLSLFGPYHRVRFAAMHARSCLSFSTVFSLGNSPDCPGRVPCRIIVLPRGIEP